MTPFEQGQRDVLSRFNLVKEAAGPVSWLSKAWTKYRPTGKGVREFAIGDPKGFLKDPWGSIRGSFAAPKLWEKGMLYGLPAFQAAQIMKQPPGQRGEEMGSLLGGTALGIAAWKPFGMLGSMAAGTVGDVLGRKAVQMTRPRPTPQPTSMPAYPGMEGY